METERSSSLAGVRAWHAAEGDVWQAVHYFCLRGKKVSAPGGARRSREEAEQAAPSHAGRGKRKRKQGGKERKRTEAKGDETVPLREGRGTLFLGRTSPVCYGGGQRAG